MTIKPYTATADDAIIHYRCVVPNSAPDLEAAKAHFVQQAKMCAEHLSQDDAKLCELYPNVPKDDVRRWLSGVHHYQLAYHFALLQREA